jgi:hypothetical protein
LELDIRGWETGDQIIFKKEVNIYFGRKSEEGA